MCGIVGKAFGSDSIDPEVVRRSADMLASRGPDDSGVWVEDNVGLGHRRLSILDITSSGHQPMISGNGRYVIVFNGEVSNFRELRDELDDSGRRWMSNSDTEVVLAAYGRWGVQCVERLNGMFAFAIWDRRERRLFVARDRMGIKPLYYHFSKNGFVFASQARSIFVLEKRISCEIDEQALRYHLECGYIPAPYSIHRQIQKLLPAHYLLVDEKGMHIRRYWDFRNIEPEKSWENSNEDHLVDELDELITRAVREHMISDMPIGAFLSGGIDSSLVTAIMSKLSPNPIKTFTIGFEEGHYDESAYAARVSEHLGTEHACECMKVDDLLGLLPLYLQEFDEPFYDSSALPTMALSRLAHKHVSVSLSGDGGDELFGGYHYYQIAQRLMPFFKMSACLRRPLASLVGVIPNHGMKLLAGALRQKDDVSSFAFTRSITKDYQSVLLPAILGKTKSIYDLFDEEATAYPQGLLPGEKGARLDTSFTLPNEYLQKVDVSSMAFSLEARVPLLDHRLVEWALRLPLSFKLRGGTNKYLLRKLAYRYVPKQLLDRPKKGFTVPIDRWMRGKLRGWSEERLFDKSLYTELPLNRPVIHKLWKLHQSGRRNVYPILWAVIALLGYMNRSKREIING